LNRPGIPSRRLSFTGLKGTKPGSLIIEEVFPGEIQGLTVETLGLKGLVRKNIKNDDHTYHVLLPLEGRSLFHSADHSLELMEHSLVRVPYHHAYDIEVKAGQTAYYLRFIKQLDQKDQEDIRKKTDLHGQLYARKFSDCPAYHEDIKSAKTISRMLLPENYVPRFCMGSVETTGPDVVAAHEHPMLEQLFFGLKSCHAVCHADNDYTPLLENTLLHIPLGSRHSVSVDKGNTLSYIWFDFFLSLEGQSYMGQQHHIIGPERP
jgi:hypothetical protein